MLKLFVGFFILILTAPQVEPDRIDWSERRKLTWADFKGEPQESAFYVATTNSGLHFTYTSTNTNNVITVKSVVTSIFFSDKSWYKPGKVNDKVLQHEQTHFDISELFARKLRKKLANFKFTNNIKSEMETLYKGNEIERQAMQARFDKETDHSKIEIVEEQWETFVALQLKVLDEYK